MAVDNTTIARPYAKAAFELANEKGKLAQWSDFLDGIADNLSNDQAQQLLNNPKLTPVQTGEVLVQALSGQLDQQQENFMRLLAENDRLGLTQEIAGLYAEQRAEAEKIAEVVVVSAQPVTSEQADNLVAQLTKRLGSKVNLATEVDESLVGGAIIKIGDQVIDGTVKGRLEKMAALLL